MKSHGKILCMVLGVIMMLSLVPAVALASGSGYDVEVWDKTGANLEGGFATLHAFRDSVNAGTSYLNKIVKLTCDVDLNNEEWTPIGNSTKKFQGVFDGGEHTISNLLITGGNTSRSVRLYHRW